MKNPSEVEGLITERAGRLLRELASRVNPGQCIVEIGAFKGRSTCFIASGAQPGVTIFSIDPHGLPGSERGRDGRFAGDDVRDEYLRNISGYDNVTTIRCLSKDAPIPEEPIGLLWIDGAHDLPSVKGDVDRFAGHVAQGGFIVIDDYGTWHPGVNKVVHGLMKSKDWTEWRLDPKPTAWAKHR